MATQNKKIIYILLTFSIIISLSHVAIDTLYHSVSSEEIILENAKQISDEKENLLKGFLSKSESIILATKNSNTFNNFLSDKNKKETVEDLFLTLMNSNQNFMQFRYLDERGQEIIKIERENLLDKARKTSNTLLQNKAKRSYFKDSKYQKENQVWFSPIELNMENGKVQVPYKPTIRTVLNVYSNKEFKGILVINYFANDIISDLGTAHLFKITLANHLGYIITSHNKDKNWGFYKKQNYTLASEYSEDFSGILTHDSYMSKKLLSRSIKLDNFEDLYLIFEVNEKFLEEQSHTKLMQEIYLTLLYLVISLLLCFIVIKIFKRIFLDLNEQKDIVHRLELASGIANIALWEYEALNKNLIWSNNIKTILESNKMISYKEFLNMIPLEDRKKVDTEFYNSINQKREFTIIHEVKLANNTIKVLEEKAKHFYDNRGLHIKSVGCTYDITKKYEADRLKDEVIKQNKEFAKLFNKFDENVIASTTNLRGIITYVSKAFCTISGYSQSELLGSPQNIVRHPETSSKLFKELWETIQSGQIWNGKLKNKNKDGSFYWVDAVIYPEYDENNLINGYSAVRQDITSQMKIKELNKNIKSSLEVASFIQESILPSELFINSCFTDKFIIWKPKDIVGGDVYFLEQLRTEDECLLMVIDCTGHGVPGAFISMLIKAIENQIIQKLLASNKKSISPAKILQEFNRRVKEILKQKQRNLASNIGFDGGVIYYNKKEKIIRYAGAVNTLIYYDKKEIKTIKGDRQSIGYKNSDVNYEFTNHEINVEKGMKFYLFSDGYIDQIGGEKNQSFSKTRTINILDKNKDKPMKLQKDILLEELKNYQNNFEQIDDITFLAVEI